MDETQDLKPDWDRPDGDPRVPEALLPITIIIPTRNEAPSLEFVLEPATRIGQQVLVVDGNSTDGTREIAERYGVQIVDDPGTGKGLALRTAVEAASEDVIVFIDADCSHDPYDIPRIVEPILSGAADMVIASRMLGGSDELHGDFNKFMRLIGSAVITLGINLRFGAYLTDSQNGFRAIRTDVIKGLNLKEKITTIEQEMLSRALRCRATVAEVSSHEYSRLHGESVITLRRVWFRYVYSWLRDLMLG